MWRLHYFVDACRLLQVATILRLRCGDEMAPAKRRALERFLAAERSPPALAALALRGPARLFGPPETLGAEWMLFSCLRLAASCCAPASASDRRRGCASTRCRRPRWRRAARSARPAGGRDRRQDRAAVAGVDPTRAAAHQPADPDDRPRSFLRGLHRQVQSGPRGWPSGARVRVVTVDPVAALPPAWRRTIESYDGLDGVFDGSRSRSAGAAAAAGQPRDGFIATTWWTAHIAAGRGAG